MTAQELEFENKKDKLRLEAVDKEIQRLRKMSRKQSAKITNLRKALYFQAFFFVSLLGVFLLRGMISFSGNTSSKQEIASLTEKYEELTSKQNSLHTTLALYKDSLNKITNLNKEKRNESGYKYRIQIGAFKEIDLNDYSANLVAINQETYDSIYQYTLGIFEDYEKALVFWHNIKKMGFADSFIMATKDGRRIPLEHLPENIRKENKSISAKHKETRSASQVAQF
ncbi:hypothetical protein [Saccharicrinis fermentans]|uniref:Uncharacterized protein n=1 Tax=Saccharicrinis fermentans DSM 9555 = JCM 21142 TaxID=869213 RepID=W7YB87_9BACT|nr:hypothetical protein [Saccharicrinis fermentans]GAF01656.1 hypothetical protein JCM21142_270 [Saccharicrinis fermentans DSM 9555 = JCM 21142]